MFRQDAPKPIPDHPEGLGLAATLATTATEVRVQAKKAEPTVGNCTREISRRVFITQVLEAWKDEGTSETQECPGEPICRSLRRGHYFSPTPDPGISEGE